MHAEDEVVLRVGRIGPGQGTGQAEAKGARSADALFDCPPHKTTSPTATSLTVAWGIDSDSAAGLKAPRHRVARHGVIGSAARRATGQGAHACRRRQTCVRGAGRGWAVLTVCFPSVAERVPVLLAGTDTVVFHSPALSATAVVAWERAPAPKTAPAAVYLTETTPPGAAPDPHTAAPLRCRIIPGANNGVAKANVVGGGGGGGGAGPGGLPPAHPGVCLRR